MSATMTYPTNVDYATALQDTGRCFRDRELAGCTLRMDNFGIPRAISGGFASVFTAQTAAGRKLAVKCFTRDVPDQQMRFREIDTALRDVPASWKVSFRFADAAVLVAGRTYPVLVMEWIDARSLISWIEDNLADRGALARLADGFAGLVADLEAAGLAHGDLQHGNLLVTAQGELKLIDYDGMYVPALRGRPPRELGLSNYQHPRRTYGDYGPWLDRFSARVIHLSLIALAADPGLWQRLHKPGGEYLLLQKYDFDEMTASRGLAALGDVSPALRTGAAELADMIRRPLEAIPPLDPNAGRPTGTTGVAVPPPAPVTAPAPPITPGVVTPGSGAWLDDHLPPPPEVRLTRPSRAARIAWYATLLVIGLLAAAGVAAPPLAPAAVAAAGLILTAWRVRFASLPQNRERRTRRREMDEVRRRHRLAAAKLSEQSAVRVSSAESHRRHLRTLDARRVRLDHDLANQHTAIDRRRDGELARLFRERANLQAWKSAELARRTADAEAEHVRDQLARYRIDRAQISGIGPAVAAELGAYGIRTAADFRGIRIMGRPGDAQTALVLHRDGRSLKVPRVGPARARTLEKWRDGLATRTRATIPPKLAAAVRTKLDAEMAVREAGLTARESGAKSTADTERRSAMVHTRLGRDALVADEQAARTAHARAIAAIDRNCVQYGGELAAIQGQLRATQRAVEALEGIRFHRFLISLTTGRS